MTPRDWHAVFESFNPADTSEAIALLCESPGLQCILKAAKGLRAERTEQAREAGQGLPRPMTSKRAGTCVRCGRGIAVGSPIMWRRELGAWHRDCEGSR